MSETIFRIPNQKLDNSIKKKSKGYAASTASTESTTSNTTTESNSTTSPISLNENAPTDNATWYGTFYNGIGSFAQNTGKFVSDAAQNTGNFVSNTIGFAKQQIKEGSKVLVKYNAGNKDWFPAYIEEDRTYPRKEGVEGSKFYIRYLDGQYEDLVPKERICLLYPDFTEEEEDKYDELYNANKRDYDDDKNFAKSIIEQRLKSYIIRLKLFKNYRNYMDQGRGFNINSLEKTSLSNEYKTEMRKVLIKGGKSRKQRKSHKNNKSRKNRKSSKQRK